MRQALLTAAIAAVLVPAAWAASGEPQHAFTKADQARARAASLRLSDFAPGWKASRSAGATSGAQPRCSNYHPDQSDLVETGKYNSPDFTRSADNSFVSVSTGVFRTAAMAKRGYARVAVRQLPACFGELFAKGITKPSAAKVVSAGPLAFPKAGDRSNAYRLVASVKTPTVTLPVTVDIVLFNKGRTDVAMIFFGIARPLPAIPGADGGCARALARHEVAQGVGCSLRYPDRRRRPIRGAPSFVWCPLEDDLETRNRAGRRPRGERPLRSPAVGADPDDPVPGRRGLRTRSGLRTVGRILLWIAIAVAMLVVSFVAGLYLWFHESVAAIQAHSKDVKSAQKFLGEPPAPGHAAIGLVIGYDHRANEAANTPSRSDTVMLIRTDPATKTVSMMSFPRDLLVNVHCPGQPVFSGKINSAYAACGAKGTVQTVSDMIGLPINYLITVNFRGFKQIVNRLGGVWIDVDRRYFNDNAGLSPTFGYAKINLQPGYQLLSGGSALDYVRYRHTDSDLFRVARQQQFVKAMKYQLEHNFSVLKMPKIVGTLTKNIEVGAGGGGGVSGRTILSYAFFAYHLPPGHFFQTQIQGLTGYADLRTTRRTSPPRSRTGRRPTSTPHRSRPRSRWAGRSSCGRRPGRRRRSPS